jgi:hypothetical protein
MSALYDFKADVLTDTVKIETVGKETEVIKLPLKMPRTAKVAADNEPDNQSERPQRKIGFFGKNAASENDVNAHTASVYTASVGDKTKTCLHCGKSYIEKIAELLLLKLEREKNYGNSQKNNIFFILICLPHFLVYLTSVCYAMYAMLIRNYLVCESVGT